jgi:Na+-transporting methylmalonyl-CoA/oxaloacetate decarboxylase beta subunit
MIVVGSKKMVVYDDVAEDKIAIYDKGIDKRAVLGQNMDFDTLPTPQFNYRSVGSTLSADEFLKIETLGILALGAIAFSIGTAAGVLMGKVMCWATGGKINPLVGAAGVSAVPMAARVVNKVGLETNQSNHLLMHAMGPNVAGVIGSAVAAGVLLALVG